MARISIRSGPALQRLRRLALDVDDELERVLRDEGQDLHEDLVGRVPVRTGRLLRSLRPRVTGLRLEVAPVDYAEDAHLAGEEPGQVLDDVADRFEELGDRVAERWREVIDDRIAS